MTLPTDKAIISVTIDKDIKELLKKHAGELDLPTSRFARNLIYIALEDFNILDQAGVLKFVGRFRKILETLPKYTKIVEKKVAKAEAKGVTISVVIDINTKELLEKYADEIGLTLKILARNLIYVALDDFKLLKKTGVIRLAGAFKKFLESYEDFDISKNGQILTS